MLAKFPFGEATMGDVSANDGIAYFPIEIKSNYGIDLWNKRSTGSATVGSELLSTSPVITEIEDGVRIVLCGSGLILTRAQGSK